jgi:hypothetical protein
MVTLVLIVRVLARNHLQSDRLSALSIAVCWSVALLLAGTHVKNKLNI